jgi:hypothetical protein
MKMKTNVRGEEGVALVTGLLVSSVVLVLAVSAVSLSIHNTDASGYDRRRLTAIDAAEAGLDYYNALLGSSYGRLRNPTRRPALVTELASSGYTLDATTCVLNATLQQTPPVSFEVTPSFDGVTGCPTVLLRSVSCPPTCPATIAAVLTSDGRAGPPGTSVGTSQRTMESKASLSATTATGSFPAAAVYGAVCVNFAANVNISSASGANDANIYVGNTCSTGPDLVVTTASSVRGSIYVQGNATIQNGNFWVRGDLWANGSVTMSGGKVDGAAISSTSNVALSQRTFVGSAKAAGTITCSPNTSCSGTPTVYGTRTPNTSSGPPPCAKEDCSYPKYTWNADDFPNDPPTSVLTTTSDCAAAQSAFSSWTTGNLYIHITSGCAFTLPTGTKNLPGNLGIISQGSITLAKAAKLTNSSGSQRSVYFMAGVFPQGAAESCGNFLADDNSGTGANIKTLIYTPQGCSATMNSNSSFAAGQIFSGTVTLRSNAPLTFMSVELPGSTTEPNGSLVDIAYKREVSST